jgi:N-acetylglucosamine-6-phosphate deacetylase
MLLSGARLVLPGAVLENGWLEVRGGRIARIGSAPLPVDATEAQRDLGGRLVVPGFVDCHVHGGGGGSYTSGDLAEARRAVSFHAGRGTTSTVASLVTAPEEDLLDALGPLSELWEEGLIAGVHLEGPFLSAARCGAQDPRFLQEPDRAVLARLLDAGKGSVRMVTLAPELPGAIELVRQIVDAGVVAAIGHSDATYDEARRAIEAGARVATHLWNGMRPLHHREPGIAGAALEHGEVVCELVADGRHVHPAVIGLAFAAAPGRMALITDAISAAGAPDGLYELGPARVRVERGEARLEGGGALAGSTIGMGDAFSYAARSAGLSVVAAAEASSLVPARVLGIDATTGSLEAGKAADLAVLDDELRVVAVMRRGTWQPVGEGAGTAWAAAG